jgi:D-lactate dehydrogenase
MDRPALRSVEDKPGMPSEIRGVADGVAALLIEARGESEPALAANLKAVNKVLDSVTSLAPAAFTADPAEYGKLWKIRKGLFPAVGAVRPVGTTVIIEDVAFPIDRLADATVELQGLLARHGYAEAIIFGHALDGNLHFVFTQDFGVAAEVERYARLMDEVCAMVVDTYGGSLKAEHGTGRNMAPFVEMEWGAEATALMWEIKGLLDPEGLLNPGVVLDRNPKAHLENLKALPAADPLVDTCIECGFCERMCPSHGLTLSPRQRITGWRVISRSGDAELARLYAYQGIDTCAACGLCATACPVGIETGLLTKALRARRRGGVARSVATLAALHYGGAMTATKAGLALANLMGIRLGHALPTAGSVPAAGRAGDGDTVVYFPTCSSRSMGPAANDPEKDSLAAVTIRVLQRAGFKVVLPEQLDGLCCGQPWDSKGFPATAAAKTAELEAALLKISNAGHLSVVMDASACAARMQAVSAVGLRVLDLVEFLHDYALPRLTVRPQGHPVLLHLNCGARKMGLESKLQALAKACAATVVVPEGVTCCGFAGDKGFTNPELNAHALRRLHAQVPAATEAGYSSNRTCEIGLADHSGVPYRHIVYLLDRVTR